MRESVVPTKAVGEASALPLPGRLDLTASGPLRDALLLRRGAALCVDAGAVEHLGTACLQVLLAAAAAWRVDGRHLDVTPMSEAFSDALRSFGLRVIIPGHCTGWRAIHALIGAFGETVVDPLAVGSRQTL